MDNIDLYLSPLDMALNLCSTIYQMADNAKANKRNCQHVVQRVKVLEGLVVTLKTKEQDGISPTVENALKDLCSTLKSAKTLMEKFTRNNTLRGLRKSGKDDDQFSTVDERLIDNFQVLSGVFLIDHGKDPSSMPPMAFNPTASMPQPSNMHFMAYNPTAPMPQPSSMPPMAFNPTASMPQPSSMPPMMYNPTAPIPQPSNMPTYSTVNPYPSQSPMPTMEMSNSIPPLSSIPYPSSSMGMMGPLSLSTQTTSVPQYGFFP